MNNPTYNMNYSDTVRAASSFLCSFAAVSFALAPHTVYGPTSTRSYVVVQPTSTYSHIDQRLRNEVHTASDDFYAKFEKIYTGFLSAQEPLGLEFESVWDDNIEFLYEA